MIRETFYDIMGIAWPTIVIFLTIVVIMRGAYLLSNKKEFVFYREIFLLLFLAYALLLFELVTEKDLSIPSGTNFVPFTEIFRYDFGSKLFIQQVIGNIILFIPFGYFATYYIKAKKPLNIILVVILSSAVIETVQYFIGRSFDIDDIILNTLGGFIGYLIYRALDAIRKVLPSFFQKPLFYNILTFFLLVLAILYFLNFFSIGGL